MAELKPGQRWRSQVCDTEIIVVRKPSEPIRLTCGGVAMVALPDEQVRAGLTMVAGLDTGNQLGKRYTSVRDPGLQILVTRAGAGTLSDGQTPLPLEESKPLPASD